MTELFIDQNPERIIGWAPSTNGILHAINAEHYYVCNRTVGCHNNIILTVDKNQWNNKICKNCLWSVKKDERM